MSKRAARQENACAPEPDRKQDWDEAEHCDRFVNVFRLTGRLDQEEEPPNYRYHISFDFQGHRGAFLRSVARCKPGRFL